MSQSLWQEAMTAASPWPKVAPLAVVDFVGVVDVVDEVEEPVLADRVVVVGVAEGVWLLEHAASASAATTPRAKQSPGADRRPSANGAHTGNQGQVQRGDPAGSQLVDCGHGVERTQSGRQAPGGGGVAPGPVGEPERRLLADGWRALDLDAVDVVLCAARPVRRGLGADPVDVLECDAGLAVEDPIDGEVDGGHLAGVDDALCSFDRRRRRPTSPRWW